MAELIEPNALRRTRNEQSAVWMDANLMETWRTGWKTQTAENHQWLVIHAQFHLARRWKTLGGLLAGAAEEIPSCRVPASSQTCCFRESGKTRGTIRCDRTIRSGLRSYFISTHRQQTLICAVFDEFTGHALAGLRFGERNAPTVLGKW